MSGSDRTLLDKLLFGAAGPQVDFSRPKGDPGVFGPDSVTWRVHANPVALAIGGVAAVILELAEPRVRTGVWEHSSFRTDPLARMRRTAEATLITTYGPTAAVEARVAMVNRMHARVTGTTPEGQAYQAMDPELLTWVQVTAGYGFLNAHVRFVEPGMSRADQDRYYAEGARLGRAFGAVDLPGSAAEADALVARWRPRLAPHPIIGEFLDIIAKTSPLGAAGRPLQPLLVEGALSLLPPWAAPELGLPDRPLRRALALPTLTAMARAAALAPSGVLRQAAERAAAPPQAQGATWSEGLAGAG